MGDIEEQRRSVLDEDGRMTPEERAFADNGAARFMNGWTLAEIEDFTGRFPKKLSPSFWELLVKLGRVARAEEVGASMLSTAAQSGSPGSNSDRN